MSVTTPRKLAAILHADVVGYSRLMGADEEATLDRLMDYRAAMTEGIKQHTGHVVDMAGDSLLAEFSSVVAATQCALELQQMLKGRNAGLPEDKRLEFRMGIEMADVITRDDAVYGDGVNVAARIQSLALPGGVCVSDAVRRAVANRLPVTFLPMGEHTVKNIAEPVRVFGVAPQNELQNLLGAAERKPPVSADRGSQASGTATDKPAIAVLPFTNLSNDPEQEYFADGISDDVITGLSRFHWFLVISRNCSFVYKGASVDVRQVAEELGVRYVLEGSVRKSGDRVRINAQLIDAATGGHIWAERYDRNIGDLFSVQDEISESITTTVAPAFISVEARRAGRKAPESFNAWDYTARGNWFLWRRGKDDIAEAIRLFEAALNIDACSTTALSGLAFALCWTYLFGWRDDLDAVRSQAYATARRAVDLDEDDAWARAILGWSHFISHELDAAVMECERALELNPSLALAESVLSIACSWQGDSDKAIQHAILAQKLSARDAGQSMWSFARACAEFGAENYEETIDWARITTRAMPEFPGAWRYLASSLGHLGRLDEARTAVQQLLRVMPHDNLRMVQARLPAFRSERLARFVEGLRKAGLPE